MIVLKAIACHAVHIMIATHAVLSLLKRLVLKNSFPINLPKLGRINVKKKLNT